MNAAKSSALLLIAAVLAAACSVLELEPERPGQLPAEKAMRESQYAADQASGLGKQHDRSADQNTASDDPSGVAKPGFPTKAAGIGVIVETGRNGPPGDDAIDWQNEWYVKGSDQVISIYAGARHDRPTQGVLLVTVWTAD